MITFVYAQEARGGIGYQNQLPWHLPNDLKFFKETTMGHTMLMGRKTFESMGKRLLPGRQTVVMTRDLNYGKEIEGLTVINSLEEGLDLAKNQELMVIGGADVFKIFLPYADQIIRTFIEQEFPSDVFMPPINEAEWQLNKVVAGTLDEKNTIPHQYEWWGHKGVSQ